MPTATACLGCDQTIFKETNSVVHANGQIVGHIHKIPKTLGRRTITPHCVRLAFWKMKDTSHLIAIAVDGIVYSEHNIPHPNIRRPSGSGTSALHYTMLQKPATTFSFIPPSSHD